MRGVAVVLLLGLAFLLLPSETASSSVYGIGKYGTCQYSSCSITMTAPSELTVNITPVGSGVRCSVASSGISVETGSSTGFSLLVSNADSSNSLSGSNGGSIEAVSGTPALPVPLGTNTWGYRVDGEQGFGLGPTAAITNGGIPAQTFAAVPQAGSSDVLISSSSAASPAKVTTVWYGVCSDTSIPNGTYSDDVVYTALTN